MPKTIDVYLAERRVGTFTNLDGDYNLFTFDDAYLDDPRPPILSQSFITTSGSSIRVVPRVHRASPPFFSNLLPEEDGLLRQLIARQHGLNRTRDFPFLDVLGNDLPGAVIMRDPGQRREIEDDEHQQSPAPALLRFSLTGVQLKFSASMLHDRFTIPLEGLGGHWIIKLPTNAFSRLPENEFAMMKFAQAIGLDVPEVRLVKLDEVAGLPADLPQLRADEPRLVYCIRRFDRSADGARHHFEDFNQIAGQAPREKYDHKATHWIANVIATLCPEEDLNEFLRRLVFGICVGNNDMHLKNWSIGYPDGRTARLSPLYDFVCTEVYYPNGELALTIGGRRRFTEINEGTLRDFAEAAEISAKRTVVIARETIEKIRETWRWFRDTIPDQSLTTSLDRHFEITPLMTGL